MSQLCLSRNCFWFLILILMISSVSTSVQADAVEKPNIIVVITDDQGYGPVGRHGHPWIRTPAMDTLYDQSTHFTRFLVSPTCAPTRSALMTGRHPMQNGITHTILERERLTLDATTLPQVLKEVGYTSGIFGKWHLGDEDPYQPHNRGFDEAFIHGAGGIGQAYDCSYADAPNNKYFDPVIKHNGSFVKTKGFCTDIFFSAALDFIKARSETGEPFFAYLATNAPHGPFIAPPKNAKRFLDMGFTENQAGFYGMIENIDENLARMQRKLDEWNLTENTLFIFMSDNGMTGGGSGRMNHQIGVDENNNIMFPYNAYTRGLKGSPDEGGVRVPFFVRWPGHVKPNQTIDTIAAHIDLLPTLAEITGAKIPEDQVQGRSLWPLIQNPKAKWSDRYLFTHVCRWKTGENPDDYQWNRFAVRNQRFRFVNNTELYDMRSDPAQTNNVINKHPDVVKKFRDAYDQFWKQSRPLMVNEMAPMSPVRPFHVEYERQLADQGIPDWTPQPGNAP